MFLHLQFFCNGLRRIDINFSLMLVEFTCEPTRSWIFVFWGSFLIIFSVSLLVISLFRFFCFFLVQSWKVVLFLQMIPFILGCPIGWHIIVCMLCLMILLIPIVLAVTSPSFLILFGPSLVFLGEYG